MINAETIIGTLLKPLIDDGTIGLYHYGNKHELKEVCNSENYQQNYPIVWLEMPFMGSSKDMVLKNTLECRLRLILGTSTRKEWLNPQRNIETYDKVLNPLYDSIVTTFQTSQYIIIKNNEINVNKFPNFWEESQGTRLNPAKRIVNDYWDVIVMEFDCVLSEPFCLVPKLLFGNAVLIDGEAILIDNEALFVT